MLKPREAIDFFLEERFVRTPHVYRGQEDSSWDLVPSLFRDSSGKTLPTSNRMENLVKFVEYYSPRFRSAFCLKNPGLFHTMKPQFWAALAQHHGTSTPLLDWSMSPFVALFMAYNSGHNAAHGKIFYTDKFRPGGELEKLGLKFRAWPEIYAYRRIVHQRGLFSFLQPSVPGQNFGEKLISEIPNLINKIDHVVIACDKASKEEGLDILDFLGVNGEILFPETIDGLNFSTRILFRV